MLPRRDFLKHGLGVAALGPLCLSEQASVAQLVSGSGELPSGGAILIRPFQPMSTSSDALARQQMKTLLRWAIRDPHSRWGAIYRVEGEEGAGGEAIERRAATKAVQQGGAPGRSLLMVGASQMGDFYVQPDPRDRGSRNLSATGLAEWDFKGEGICQLLCDLHGPDARSDARGRSGAEWLWISPVERADQAAFLAWYLQALMPYVAMHGRAMRSRLYGIVDGTASLLMVCEFGDAAAHARFRGDMTDGRIGVTAKGPAPILARRIMGQAHG